MKKIRLILGLSLILLVFVCPVWAQQKGLEIEGLIIDQTRTRFGHDFFQSFNLFWEPPPGIKDYNILISEQANPRFGTWIAVEVNTNMVYRNRLRPGIVQIEARAKEAVEATREFLFHLEDHEKALEEERDLKGSGIY